MAFFWKQERKIIHKIETYLDRIDTCKSSFRECMQKLILSGISELTNNKIEEVHQAESKADDLRREIELDLYRKALIPESRGDVLGLLETLDHIPGKFQSLCYQMSSQRMEIPEQFRQDFLSLIKINLDSFELLREAVLCLFHSQKGVTEEVAAIDAKESESDRIERKLIDNIFLSDLEKADKILLKEIVVNIGDISDLVQSTSDRLSLAVIKRRI